MDKVGTIIYINGPVVKAKGMKGFIMRELVYVGELKLVGEIIELEGDTGTIQVYEETSGMQPGEPVFSTGNPLSVKLGPGIMGNIFDGIQRPLPFIKQKSGAFISRGLDIDVLNKETHWKIKVEVEQGQKVNPGEVIAEVEETSIITHRIMVPPGLKGEIKEVVPDGEYTIEQDIVKIESEEGEVVAVKMYQEWPVRSPRPYQSRNQIRELLLTGQRVIDTFFPIGKGGSAAIPGGFGTGKTITQHQLAKWADTDIIVYVGCGERGNEMTDVLEEFSELIDPKTGKSMMERTVLIANTSNMPVAAREASIYTGITIAEYYRDMGYDVALMADSTSRWAEALREIAGRLEEMPAEEGFPAYLPTRLAEFYERAGDVNVLGQDRRGTVSLIGAVSPPASDFSEPVTRSTKRFVRCFWALDKDLAGARHFPAISWLDSYTEYLDQLSSWIEENIHEEWIELRNKAMELLKEEDRLQEMVQLVGEDVLPDNQRLILEISRLLKIGFLQQNAFSKVDRYTTIEKQYWMLKIILDLYNLARPLVNSNVPISKVRNEELFSDILQMKETIPNDNPDRFKELKNRIDSFYEELQEKYEL